MDKDQPTEQCSDSQLVDRANAGGPAAAEAFSILYRRHRDYVLRIARRYANDDGLALDATQETFMYLLRRFPPPPGNRLELTAMLTTLLFPVAKHAALGAKQKRDRMRLISPNAEDSEDMSLPADRGEQEDMQAVLARLGDEHREVVWLRFVDDLSMTEIAERLGVPLGTVKSRLHNAVKKLREDPAVKDFFLNA